MNRPSPSGDSEVITHLKTMAAASANKDAKDFALFLDGEHAEGHFVNDENLLGCLSQNLLIPEERAKVLYELLTCPVCREEFAWLVQVGGVILPSRRSKYQIAKERFRLVRRLAPVVVAASLLAGAVWLWGFRTETIPVARARAALESGRYMQVLDIGVQFTGKTGRALSPELGHLVEEAAYRLAKGSLGDGNFREVFSIQDRLSSLGVESARVKNLAFQAQRGLTVERALERFGSLLDFGYDLRGRCLIKSAFFRPPLPLPDKNGLGTSGGETPPADQSAAAVDTREQEDLGFAVDAVARRLVAEYEQALKNHPTETSFFLNFGHLCLSYGHLERARNLFAQVLKFESENSLALLGLGLVAFQQGEFEKAREYFSSAVRVDPSLIPARINLAICYEALGQTEWAEAMWQELLIRVTEPQLRAQIESHLATRSQRD